jgi:hypothetical protein
MNKSEKAAEPSMEEILASIRKIIAEEPLAGRSAPATGAPSPGRVATPAAAQAAPAPATRMARADLARSTPSRTGPEGKPGQEEDDLADLLEPAPPRAAAPAGRPAAAASPAEPAVTRPAPSKARSVDALSMLEGLSTARLEGVNGTSPPAPKVPLPPVAAPAPMLPRSAANPAPMPPAMRDAPPVRETPAPAPAPAKWAAPSGIGTGGVLPAASQPDPLLGAMPPTPLAPAPPASTDRQRPAASGQPSILQLWGGSAADIAPPVQADVPAAPADGAGASPAPAAVAGIPPSPASAAAATAPAPAPAPHEAVRTLEETVSELLRPMLRQWLDANMPRIVEKALRIEMAESLKPGQPSADKPS